MPLLYYIPLYHIYMLYYVTSYSIILCYETCSLFNESIDGDDKLFFILLKKILIPMLLHKKMLHYNINIYIYIYLIL